MFADEARFGRMNRPRPCWAPQGTRPQVASQLVREFVYLYGAVSPKDGTCVYLIMPAPNTECFQIFLDTLAKKYRRQFILLFVDGAGNHHSDELKVPDNVMLHFLPPYSPELNPQENLCRVMGLRQGARRRNVLRLAADLAGIGGATASPVASRRLPANSAAPSCS
jgi:transposase